MDKWQRLRLERKGQIVVLSVHHTGTNFTTDEILRAFQPHHYQYEICNHDIPYSKIRVHIEPKLMKWVRYWAENGCAVVPLRHPKAIFTSWVARNKNRDNLVEQINLLKTEVHPHNQIYLPIDSPDRDKWLDQLRAATGKAMSTKWPVIASVIGKPRQYPELSPKDKELLHSVTNDGFFHTFYPE